MPGCGLTRCFNQFQKVLSVSTRPSWRTRGLEAAAKLTGLEVTIPIQPSLHEHLVTAFQNIGSDNRTIKRPLRGSAKAWLAHLDMLKFVVASGFISTLIIEDDADWDISVREQMKLVSLNIRYFMNTPDSDVSPYGAEWDVLWIGHCGKVTEPLTPRVEYADSSLMPFESYSSWAKEWLFNMREGHRAVQRTRDAICTFGYAVTQAGAQNSLKILGGGQHEALDVALTTECRHQRLKCITINPELIQHYTPERGTGYVSLNNEASGLGHSSDDSKFEHIIGSTPNIRNSARCAALFKNVCPAPPTKASDWGFGEYQLDESVVKS